MFIFYIILNKVKKWVIYLVNSVFFLIFAAELIFNDKKYG